MLYGQYEPNTFGIGGGIMYNKIQSDFNSEEKSGLNVQIQYFILENTALGISATHTQTIEHLKTPLSKRRTLYKKSKIGPFLRYYTPLYEQLNFFGILGLEYGVWVNKTTSKYDNFSALNHVYTLYLSPGLSYQFNDLVTLETELGLINWSALRSKLPGREFYTHVFNADFKTAIIKFNILFIL